MAVDTSMETALVWARQFYWVRELPNEVTTDTGLLLMIVNKIEICITSEINYNIDYVERLLGRKLTDIEKSTMRHPVFEEYDSSRKTRFWSCIQSNLRGLIRYNDSSLLNIGFRLWSGCLSVAKILDNRRNYSEDDIRRITYGLARYSEGDQIHMNGQEIACLFMLTRGQKKLIDFHRFPPDSAPRKYERLCV